MRINANLWTFFCIFSLSFLISSNIAFAGLCEKGSGYTTYIYDQDCNQDGPCNKKILSLDEAWKCRVGVYPTFPRCEAYPYCRLDNPKLILKCAYDDTTLPDGVRFFIAK